jgi:hypothetical protein
MIDMICEDTLTDSYQVAIVSIMNVALTDHWDKFIRRLITSGHQHRSTAELGAVDYCQWNWYFRVTFPSRR